MLAYIPTILSIYWIQQQKIADYIIRPGIIQNLIAPKFINIDLDSSKRYYRNFLKWSVPYKE